MAINVFQIDNKKVEVLTGESATGKFSIKIEGLSELDFFNEFNTQRLSSEEDVNLDNKIIDYCDIVFKLAKLFKDRGDIGSAHAIEDHYFNQFIPLWKLCRNKRLRIQSVQVWNIAINLAIDWEKDNNSIIHMGTPYFFLGAEHLSNGSINLDAGFSFLFAAMDEDKRFAIESGTPHSYRSSPAYLTTSLLNEKDNALYLLVNDIANKLGQEIKIYNKLYNKKMSLKVLRKNFLDNPNLEKEKFFFVYNLYSFIEFKKILDSPYGKTIFSENKVMDLLFNFCLIVEILFTYKYGKEGLFANIIEYSKENIVLSSKTKISEQEIRKTIPLNRLDEKNPIFVFSEAIKKILEDRIFIKDNEISKPFNLLLTTWMLRNCGGHTISVEPIITQNYATILQRILFSTFMIVEKLD